MRHRIVLLLPAAVAALALAGCGSGGGKTAKTAKPAAQAACGKVTTAADAAAQVKVVQGTAPCGEAMSVFKAFFAEVAGGKAPGQGSGGGLTVQGWTCTIYPEDQPQADHRGADCRKGGATVAAFQ